MADSNTMRGGDLVLAPGEFAYVLDTTKGLVNTIVGPNKISMSNTDQPVRWDRQTLRFTRCDADKAIQTNSIAPEGFYVELLNPAEDGKSPRDGASSTSAPLSVGHRVNIHGPIHFPLWPGQMATVIKGHHLRSNQYLLAQVYNDAEATKNWQKAVLKPQGGESAATPTPQSFTPGQLLIIKGTDVAFFMPPTGVKVVPENGTYIREAVTLERLEYCILLDEDGNKRFVKGPDVVFPEPTETFIVKDEQRKFKAIELNETTGIYVKVIADYTENDVPHKTGDELFITGKEQAIYFQREEHSVIRYGDQTKHYAVAVPAGEGRYVLDRNTGVVDLIHGPKMLLCDPRTQVIVRRVLAEKTVKLWYPDNDRVVQINRALEEQVKAAGEGAQYLSSPIANTMAAMSLMDTTVQNKSRQIAGDQFNRGTSFTPPRTITLDTKYEGAVSISVWTGYAVLVISKTGARRVVSGPETFLLQYDETLAPLELSTGKPKMDTTLFRTVYLRVHNNKVSDIITVETQDLVKVKLALSYRINFEGDDSKRWFEVENYVRLLCDHLRSRIRNIAKRTNVQAFYAATIDLIRDNVLGAIPEAGTPRPGLTFAENGMRVYDLEVLDVQIENPAIAKLLLDDRTEELSLTIRVAKDERMLEATKKIELVKRETATELNATVLAMNTLATGEISAVLATNLSRVEAEAQVEARKLTKKADEQAALNALNAAEIARQQATDAQEIETKRAQIELELKRIVGETEEITKRATAVSPALAATLTTFSDQALVEKIATALAPMAAMNGVSAADVLAQLFRGTPFEGVMKTLGTRSRMPVATE